jgi:hypothetical protein
MQRTMDVAQQISLLEGFDQVADRPGFERLDACAFVGEGGNEDDRDLIPLVSCLPRALRRVLA